MSKTVRFAAYGTLRKGSYNFDRMKGLFGDDFRHVETRETTGIKMFCNNRAYPYGVASTATPVVVDIIECSTECFDLITRMENGAGYQLKDLDVEGTVFKTFLINPISINVSGDVGKDWLKYEKADYKQQA